MTTTLPNFVTALSKKFNFQLVSTLGLLLLLLTSNLSFGQTYYNMASGDYNETFTSWTTPATGVNWSSVAVAAVGTIPVATNMTVSSASFTTATAGGLQNGTTNLQFLSTGTPNNTTSVAFDLNLNFTGRNAGFLSFNAATVFNSTGDRGASLKVYYSTNGTTWTELTATNLPFNAINNVASSAVVNVALPSALNNQATVKLRFYNHNGQTLGNTGSRPKISIDDVVVTSYGAYTNTGATIVNGGVNFVGQPQNPTAYAQPTNCTAGDYRVLNYRKVSTTANNTTDGRGQWFTTVLAQSAGGNAFAGNYGGGSNNGFLFTSGGGCGATGNFNDKWNFGGVGQAALNAVNGTTLNSTTDMGLNMSTAGYYTFSMKDVYNTNGPAFYVGYTTYPPVNIVSTTQTAVCSTTATVTATLSAAPSSQEAFYLRYRVTTNDFTASTSQVLGTVSGTTVTFNLTGLTNGVTYFYYLLSTTHASYTNLTEVDKSLSCLKYLDNSGSNYSFTTATTSPTITVQPSTLSSVVSGTSSNVATYSVTATNAATYQWQYATTVGGTYANVANATPAGVTYAGNTTATLTVTASSTTPNSGSYFYRCVVTSACGTSVNSNGAQMIVYCAATGNNTYSTGTTLVNYAGINNATLTKTAGYNNYTAQNAVVTAGAANNITINVNSGGNFTVFTRVYIDWDQNGVFNTTTGSAGGPGETYLLGSAVNVTNGVTSLSPLSITVPSGAALGNTRMRVVTIFGSGGTDPFTTSSMCLASTDAEVEDYTVTVGAGCTQPTTQATIGAYTANTTGTSLTVNWTRGNGTGGVIVVARATATSNVLPTGGTTYTPSTVGAFGGTTTTGTGNIVVYNGTGTTVDVTGLTAGTSYTFSVYEYNTTSNCYNTSASSSAVTTCTSGTPSVAITVTTGANPTCTGSSVTFTATPTNGGTPTYQWKLNGTNVGTNSTTYTNAALANGDLVSCVMTNSAACTTTATSNTITISVTAAPTTSNAGTAQSSCGGTTPVTLAANTPSVGTGAWTVTSGPSTLVSQFSSTTNPTAVFTPAGGTGAYVLTWTIANSPCTASASNVTITVNAAPTATAANGGPYCAGGTIQLTGGPSSGVSNYAWSGPNSYSVSGAAGTGINENFDGTVTGWNFTSVTATTAQVCSGTKSLLFDAVNDAAITPSVTNPNQLTFNIARSTTPSPVMSIAVQISDASPASQTSGPWTTITTAGATSVTGSCVSVGPIDLSSYTGVRYVRFLDTRASGTQQRDIDDVVLTTIAPTQSPSITNATTAMSGTYTLTTTNSFSCTATATTTVTVNPLPQGSLTANGPFCATGSGQLTWTATAGTGPYTVVYNDGTANRTATGVVSGTPFAVFTTPVTSTTTYTLVSVTDSSSTTCGRSTDFTGASATITVSPTPTTANAGPDQLVCSTNTITLAANTASSGTGAWSIISGSGGTITTPSSPTSTFSGTAGTTYTLRWTISSGVCTASTDDVVITIFSPLDFVNLQFPGSATICQGSSMTAYGQVYEANVTPGAGQGANIIVEFGYNGTNTNPSTWSNWYTASYNSTVTNNNDEYQYNFTPPTNGTFYYTFRYKQGTCDTWQYGGFSGTGGGTWGGANVSGILTVNSNAAHTISLSSGSATPALCQNTLLGNTIVYAIGGGATSAGVTGLPSGMSGSFNSGNFTINGTPNVSGIFNFTVTTTGNSCASAVTATGTITVSSDLDFVNLQWPPSGSICSTGTYTVYGQVYESGVTNSAGQGSGITVEFGYNGTNSNPSTWTNWSTASYSIDSGNNDEYLYTFTPPSSGTFYYTFRYRLGSCNWIYGGYSAGGGGAWSGSNVSGILTVTASPSAGTLSGTQAVCASGTTTFASTVSGGAWSSSDSGVATIDASTGVVTPVAAGTATMTYTVTGTGGCSNATNTRTVTVNQVTNGGTASSNQIICSGETPSAITLASSVGSVVKWQSSSDAAFTSPTDITNTTTTLTLGSLSATTYYRAVVQSGACSSANSNVVTITVNSLPTVSIASNNSPVCSGAASFSLTGTTDAVVTYNINGGTNATTTLTGGAATISVPNPFASQVLTLVSVANNGCTSSLSDTSTVSVIATTYDGTSWSNGNPDSSKLAIFTGNYTIAADLTACSLRVTNNAVVTVNSNYNVYLNGAITVDSGSSFTMNNNTNLLQSDASAVNTGNIIVKRNTSTIVRLDHTLWSSPVTGQNLFSFSPNTLVNRFYVYNTATNSYVTTGLSNTSLFTPAKGFAVRAPNNQSATTPAVWTGTFTGVPNNGTKTFTLATNAANGYNYNLVGNPYPSAISASNFYAANASKIGGTLYFYAHTLTMNASGIFPTGTNYATWTGLGGAAATAGDGHTPAVAPNGIIQVGQGFIVRATASGDVTFTNSMRVANQQNQFMKAATASAETHRMWLNLKTDTGVDVNQILVGYMDGATQGVDAGLDGLSFGNTGSYLYSKIENDNFVIQARSLPFDVTDEVPLGFNCATAGSYSISLTNTDGLFAADQDILVRDNLTGTDTSIKTVPYTFNSETGVFDTRFRLVYTQALGVPSTNFTENSVIVYKNTDWFHVNTKGIEMKDIMVYDISGRLIYSKKDINATTAVLNGLTTTNQVLILKINSIEDKTVTIKVIN